MYPEGVDAVGMGYVTGGWAGVGKDAAVGMR